MSSPEPSELIASIADMPVEQQIKLVKAHCLTIKAKAAVEFVQHPAVKAWISRYVKEINASVRIPKSHGGPG